MAVVQGPASHRAVVRVFDGEIIEKDQLVRYEGEPNWKFEPLQPGEAVKWRNSIAQPPRALQENLRTKATLRAPMSPDEVEREQSIRRQRNAPIRIA